MMIIIPRNKFRNCPLSNFEYGSCEAIGNDEGGEIICNNSDALPDKCPLLNGPITIRLEEE